ncbi:phage holin family protein [Phycicoccus sp. BSK3Z-2]|uniref:Phage holin family protein n=1 Tax=Phycicoccus avicenniae TaxID=2828860 RepID=A0A941D789_9MICO|nr:phage holin family protein [Phycicoccus avicenniae]MBR7743399.1 phage holin family protein [Phycicoccus avicenniae]
MPPESNERTIGQLVADATHDVQAIVRSEIDLAKAEIAAGAKAKGTGIGLFAGAGFVALLGVIFLFHTLARVIAIWLPVWAGYLVVTVFMFVVAAVVGLVGLRVFKSASPTPEKAIREGKATVATLKGEQR